MRKCEKTMERKEQLIALLQQADQNTSAAFIQLAEEICFLEKQLEELKKLPFLKVHQNNALLQKATPAAKQYKELLQQYTNCIKVLAAICRHDITKGDSPLRNWIKSFTKNGG